MMVQDNVVKPLNDLRLRLRRLLGDFPPLRFVQLERKLMVGLPHMRVEQLLLQSASGETIRAILTGPEELWQELPAVLYCHAHGNRYAMGANELIEGRPALLPLPYGAALAQQGIVALSIDMPCFGLRTESKEIELSKRLLFQGQTLLGQMLAELGAALDFLGKIDGVDPSRIGAFGFSMGATHAYWLAALEPNLRALAHACAFADLGTLVSTGAHDLHGLYMSVPSLLQHFNTGDIAAMAAPRPQLACMGLLDPLTPPTAVDAALSDVLAGYTAAGAEAYFTSVISMDSGHIETEEMRREVLAFFKRWL
jgi:dienelactone hydrolase